MSNRSNNKKAKILSSKIKRRLNQDEIDLLETWGDWLSDLACGLEAPETEAQVRFVEVVNGNAVPESQYEILWVKLEKIRLEIAQEEEELEMAKEEKEEKSRLNRLNEKRSTNKKWGSRTGFPKDSSEFPLPSSVYGMLTYEQRNFIKKNGYTLVDLVQKRIEPRTDSETEFLIIVSGNYEKNNKFHEALYKIFEPYCKAAPPTASEYRSFKRIRYHGNLFGPINEDIDSELRDIEDRGMTRSSDWQDFDEPDNWD